MFASCFFFLSISSISAQDTLGSQSSTIQYSSFDAQNSTEEVLDVPADFAMVKTTKAIPSGLNGFYERKRIQIVVNADYNTYGYNTSRIADNERLFQKSGLSNMSLGAGVLWEPKGFNRKLGIELDMAFASYQELARVNAGILPFKNVTTLSFALLPQFVFYQNKAETLSLFVQAGPTFEKVIKESTPVNTFGTYDDILGYKVGVGTRFGRLFTSVNFSQNNSGTHSWVSIVKSTITKVGLSLGYNLSKS